MTPSDIDYVLISHLDCDHANGLRQVKEAKNILVSELEELLKAKVIIIPAFKTDMTEENPLDNNVRIGSFEDTVLFQDKLEKNYYGKNMQ